MHKVQLMLLNEVAEKRGRKIYYNTVKGNRTNK